ncbi:PAS domain-containing sensor histidine kinase [Dyadobacter luteus]|uniref:histidine kinase n=1 Tax=Dyadobacter luteus TaxID=2259619 RepID=A0A3D8Y287_9BACT|nr:ATP-binding protein [Dyadobacter luteus]REA55181.1 PAS domain-containing sensor histidine kinase [Dyadobacter luteus]
MEDNRTRQQLLDQIEYLSEQLQESNDTIEAIRTGQVDAIIVQDPDAGQQLYTLRSADQTYRVFIEKMNEGAVTIDRQGIILYCNSMFAAMVGAPLSSVVGILLESFVADESLEDFQDLIRKGWTTDLKIELLIRQNNKTIPCQLSVATLELDGRESLSVIVTDLSFQKDIQRLLSENNQRLQLANQQLEASNYDLQQFASVASHDLQEPLRKILIFSNLLSTAYHQESNPEITTYLQKISSSSIRMRNMVDDILKYSLISSQEANSEVIELNDVINEIKEDYEVLIQEKDVELIVQSLPVVKAIRSQIKQVFQNLISNSIKFSSPGTAPVIRIWTRPHAEDSRPSPVPMHCIVVEDNGIGFKTEYRDKIFSLFERLNTKERYEGSGIGLSVTKKIIEKHGGQITADGDQGHGATFTIWLPSA